jgi:hypothetical protein
VFRHFLFSSETRDAEDNERNGGSREIIIIIIIIITKTYIEFSFSRGGYRIAHWNGFLAQPVSSKTQVPAGIPNPALFLGVTTGLVSS